MMPHSTRGELNSRRKVMTQPWVSIRPRLLKSQEQIQVNRGEGTLKGAGRATCALLYLIEREGELPPGTLHPPLAHSCLVWVPKCLQASVRPTGEWDVRDPPLTVESSIISSLSWWSQTKSVPYGAVWVLFCVHQGSGLGGHPYPSPGSPAGGRRANWGGGARCLGAAHMAGSPQPQPRTD